MKKLLPLLFLIAGFSQPAAAADISLLSALSQAEFRLLSEDFGSALSYKPVTPTASLGGILGVGFDVGVEVTSTDISKSAAALDKATNSTTGLSSLIVPKLHAFVGLPFGVDVGAFTSVIPSSNIKVTGGELRVAILKGGVVSPTVSVRGAMTRMSGVDQLSFNTRSLDISISKGFAILTPYAGVGQVWVKSTPNGTAAAVLTSESISQNKVFAGANLNLGITNFDLEYDNTGGATSYSLKMGFRW